MIKVLRKGAQLILKVLYPKLYFLESKEIDVSHLDCTIVNSTISKKANISGRGLISDSEIGDYTYVSFNPVIVNTKIGKFCSIGPNLLCGWGTHPTNGISTSPAFYSTKNQAGISFSKTNKVKENLAISIGNDVFIGMNVTILDGISIGNGAIIGAGAVVSKNIPPYSIAVGSPIQVIKYRFEEDIINRLQEINWWDFDESKLKDVEEYFFDISKFVKKHKI